MPQCSAIPCSYVCVCVCACACSCVCSRVQWDIFHPGGKWDPSHPKTTYLGKKDTTELYNKTVPGADAWSVTSHLPFTKNDTINYT